MSLSDDWKVHGKTAVPALEEEKTAVTGGLEEGNTLLRWARLAAGYLSEVTVLLDSEEKSELTLTSSV